eukprot:6455191-Amphidinium_carterae.3
MPSSVHQTTRNQMHPTKSDTGARFAGPHLRIENRSSQHEATVTPSDGAQRFEQRSECHVHVTWITEEHSVINIG